MLPFYFGVRVNDESWALDNLGVSVEVSPQPVITHIAASETKATITWSATSSLTYRVQSKTNLLDADWKDLVPLVTATNTSADFSEPRGTGNRFYRVMVVP